MKTKILSIITVLLMTINLSANNLQISNVVASGSDITFEISWENAWRQTEKFHDAVWVFGKIKPTNEEVWSHADISSGFTSYPLEIVTVPDQKGVYVSLSDNYNGDINSVMVTLTISNNVLYPDVKVFGIEMVYIPEGPFYVGDVTSPKTLGGYIEDSSDVAEPYHITHSGLLEVGQLDHQLWAKDDYIYNQNVPASFPNGYNAFYCMKYEISQGQYVEFLNTLTREQQIGICPSDLSDTVPEYKYPFLNQNSPLNGRQGITCDSVLTPNKPITFYMDINNNGINNEYNDGHTHAMIGYLSLQNVFLSYLDWACLRPMTEFEFEKTARGEAYPVSGEYAWGTTTITQISGHQNIYTPDETASNQGAIGLSNVTGALNWSSTVRCGIEAFDGATRVQAGAGYYGVMNLTGNATEFTIYHENENHLFTGQNSDGILSNSGYNEADWTGIILGKKGGSVDNGDGTYVNYGFYVISGRSAGGVNPMGYNIFGRGVRSID